jgi:hypothetical protein
VQAYDDVKGVGIDDNDKPAALVRISSLFLIMVMMTVYLIMVMKIS